MKKDHVVDSSTYCSIHRHTLIAYILLTAWCRVLLEKLTGLQLVKKFPAFHGTRRFITALTSVRHLSISWASPIGKCYETESKANGVTGGDKRQVTQ